MIFALNTVTVGAAVAVILLVVLMKLYLNLQVIETTFMMSTLLTELKEQMDRGN